MAQVARELEIAVKSIAKKLISVGRVLGPYVAIELLMPGGSLLALALWLYRMSAARRLLVSPAVAQASANISDSQ
jgi:hypothetical protein